MKCPKCGFVSFDHLDNCKKCGRDLTEDKALLGIKSIRKKVEEASPAPSETAQEEDSARSGEFGDELADSFSLDDISFGDDEAMPSEIQVDLADPAAVQPEETADEDFDFGGLSSVDMSGLPGEEVSIDMETSSFEENLDDVSFETEYEPSFDNKIERPSGGVSVTEVEQGPVAAEVKAPEETLSFDMSSFIEEGIEEEAVSDGAGADLSFGEDISLGEGGFDVPAAPEDAVPDEEPGFEYSTDDNFFSADELEEGEGEEAKAGAAEESIEGLPGGDLAAAIADVTENEQMPLAFEDEESEPGDEDEEGSCQVEIIPNIKDVKKAGFIRRTFAFVVDSIIQSVIIYAFLFAGLYALKRGVSMTGGALSFDQILNLVVPLMLLSCLVNAGYCTFFHWATGQTPGKMLFKLRVVSTDGGPVSLMRSFVRWIGYFISALPLMMGYVMALIDRQHQTLHDKIARTYVIDLRGLPEKEEEGSEGFEESGVDPEEGLTEEG